MAVILQDVLPAELKKKREVLMWMVADVKYVGIITI